MEAVMHTWCLPGKLDSYTRMKQYQWATIKCEPIRDMVRNLLLRDELLDHTLILWVSSWWYFLRYNWSLTDEIAKTKDICMLFNHSSFSTPLYLAPPPPPPLPLKGRIVEISHLGFWRATTVCLYLLYFTSQGTIALLELAALNWVREIGWFSLLHPWTLRVLKTLFWRDK